MVSTPEIATIAGAIVALLFSGNIFFIKRLILKLDTTSAAHEATTAGVLSLSQTVKAVSEQIHEIKVDLKEFRRLEMEVAILRAQCAVCEFLKPARVENNIRPKP